MMPSCCLPPSHSLLRSKESPPKFCQAASHPRLHRCRVRKQGHQLVTESALKRKCVPATTMTTPGGGPGSEGGHRSLGPVGGHEAQAAGGPRTAGRLSRGVAGRAFLGWAPVVCLLPHTLVCLWLMVHAGHLSVRTSKHWRRQPSCTWPVLWLLCNASKTQPKLSRCRVNDRPLHQCGTSFWCSP